MIAVGRVPKRLGEVFVVLPALPLFVFKFGPFFLRDIGAVFDVLQEASLGFAVASMGGVTSASMRFSSRLLPLGFWTTDEIVMR